MDITINILEVASELAQKEVEKHFNYQSSLIYERVSDDETRYTEEAQSIFDENYDYFYEFLDNLKE